MCASSFSYFSHSFAICSRRTRWASILAAMVLWISHNCSPGGVGRGAVSLLSSFGSGLLVFRILGKERIARQIITPLPKVTAGFLIDCFMVCVAHRDQFEHFRAVQVWLCI